MEKIWYIVINETEEGPYSYVDLYNDHRITPETLAWREGFETWIPIKKIPELEELFEKRPPSKGEEEEEDESGLPPTDEIVLDYGGEPSFPYLWVIVFILVVIYIIYKVFGLL